jgi:hypothetical protein
MAFCESRGASGWCLYIGHEMYDTGIIINISKVTDTSSHNLPSNGYANA